MSNFCLKSRQAHGTLRGYPVVRHTNATRNRLGNVPRPLLTFGKTSRLSPVSFLLHPDLPAAESVSVHLISIQHCRTDHN